MYICSAKLPFMETPKKNEIERFAQEHGHAFHARVVKDLRDLGWDVLISPFYRDNATDKAREADIIAEKDIAFGLNSESTIHHGFFTVRLIIECKYIKDPLIFWFDNHNPDAVEERIIKDIPFFERMKSNSSIKNHHWFQWNKVAKLFTVYSSKSNAQERQPENDFVFSAVDKVLGCTLAYRSEKRFSSPKYQEQYIFKARTNGTTIPIITYPIILFNDFSKIYQTEISNNPILREMTKEASFPLEVNYEFVRYLPMRQTLKEYFLIDIVDASKLEKYLNIIKDYDLKSALNFL